MCSVFVITLSHVSSSLSAFDRTREGGGEEGGG